MTLLVTGTGTGVGKTVVTAAIAALALSRGERVTVLKPAQTGEPPGSGGDLEAVRQLTGPLRTVELARYPDPLSPEAAARRSGLPALTRQQGVTAIDAAAAGTDLVLVEGAGGLLVRYHRSGWTVADLAVDRQLAVVLVTTAGLGALNATALTMEALQTRGLALHALVIGAWPARPGLAERSNLTDLAVIAGQPVAGAVPAGAGRLAPAAFLAMAGTALGAVFGGTFEAHRLECGDADRTAPL